VSYATDTTRKVYGPDGQYYMWPSLQCQDYAHNNNNNHYDNDHICIVPDTKLEVLEKTTTGVKTVLKSNASSKTRFTIARQSICRQTIKRTIITHVTWHSPPPWNYSSQSTQSRKWSTYGFESPRWHRL